MILYIDEQLYNHILNRCMKNKTQSTFITLHRRYRIYAAWDDTLNESALYYMENKEMVKVIVKEAKPKSIHPCAKIIKDSFKGDNPHLSKFVFLGYFGFTPLTKCGTNARQIHNEYDEYWSKFEHYF